MDLSSAVRARACPGGTNGTAMTRRFMHKLLLNTYYLVESRELVHKEQWQTASNVVREADGCRGARKVGFDIQSDRRPEPRSFNTNHNAYYLEKS